MHTDQTNTINISDVSLSPIKVVEAVFENFLKKEIILVFIQLNMMKKLY